MNRKRSRLPRAGSARCVKWKSNFSLLKIRQANQMLYISVMSVTSCVVFRPFVPSWFFCFVWASALLYEADHTMPWASCCCHHNAQCGKWFSNLPGIGSLQTSRPDAINSRRGRQYSYLVSVPVGQFFHYYGGQLWRSSVATFLWSVLDTPLLRKYQYTNFAT